MTLLTPEEAQALYLKSAKGQLVDLISVKTEEKERRSQRRKGITEQVMNMNRRNAHYEKVAAEGKAAPASVPGLPADWRDQHWKVKVKLAEDLTGQEIEKTEDKSAVDQAEEILERLEKGSD